MVQQSLLTVKLWNRHGLEIGRWTIPDSHRNGAEQFIATLIRYGDLAGLTAGDKITVQSQYL
jgi:hypothetical protein